MRGDFVYLIYQVVVIVGALGQLAVSPKPLSSQKVIGTFLLWSLVLNAGVAGVAGFVAHAFNADGTAALIGWAPGSPFQFEVAAANLGFGVLGFLCIWIRGLFWWATAIGSGVFMLGAAYKHIEDIILNQNYAPGNAGVVLYWDIIVPIVHVVLLTAVADRRRSAIGPAAPRGVR